MSTSPRWTWRTWPCTARRAICAAVSVGNTWSTREASVNGTGGMVSVMSSLPCAAHRDREGASLRMCTLLRAGLRRAMAPGLPRRAFRGHPDLAAALAASRFADRVAAAWDRDLRSGHAPCRRRCTRRCGTARMPSPYAPVCLGADERGVDEVLREKPRLELT